MPDDRRDGQRSLVYDAEHLVHRLLDRSADFPVIDLAGSRLTLPVERRFASAWTRCSTTSTGCWRCRRSRARWPRAAVPVTARERQGRGSRPLRTRRRGDRGARHHPRRASGRCGNWCCCTNSHTTSPTTTSRPTAAPFVARLVDLADVVVGPGGGVPAAGHVPGERRPGRLTGPAIDGRRQPGARPHRTAQRALNLGAPRSFAEICDGSSSSIGSGHSMPSASSIGQNAMPAMPGIHSSVKQ